MRTHLLRGSFSRMGCARLRGRIRRLFGYISSRWCVVELASEHKMDKQYLFQPIDVKKMDFERDVYSVYLDMALCQTVVLGLAVFGKDSTLVRAYWNSRAGMDHWFVMDNHRPAGVDFVAQADLWVCVCLSCSYPFCLCGTLLCSFTGYHDAQELRYVQKLRDRQEALEISLSGAFITLCV